MANLRKASMPRLSDGYAPGNAILWTGEVQAIQHQSTSTAATKITVPGNWFCFYSTTGCHINIGGTNVAPASATAEDQCFPIPDGRAGGGWTGPVYVDPSFRGTSSDFYITAIRDDADGYLYIAQAYPNASTRTEGASTTTTTTTTTSTTTTT